MKTQLDKLFVPALRARMGDWVYYIGFMRMSDVAERISIAEEIHKTKKLKALIQRKLTDRSSSIAEYLVKEQQRLFNAIVVGIYGGQPDWYELKIGGNELLKASQLPAYITGSIGVLRLTGREHLFALDGQHRVAGIRKAVPIKRSKSVSLGEEEVACVFVGHKRTAAGMQRTRRLFTTLNRYAKPVTLAEIIALDEDDIAAIVTRDILEGKGLMREAKVSFSLSRAMSGDQENITNITTLYTCMSRYLRKERSPQQWKEYRLRRPSDGEISKAGTDVEELWNVLRQAFKPLRDVSAGRARAEKFRNERGGHLLFRPVGLEMSVDAIAYATASRALSLDATIARLAKIPMTLARPPWKGLLWSESGMETGKGRKAVARDLILYMIGCRFWKPISTKNAAIKRLRERLAHAQNRTLSQVEMPPVRGDWN